MMTESSLSIWIELGLLATFMIFAVSLLVGVYLKTHDKFGEGNDKPIRSIGKWGFFSRNKRRSDRTICNLTLDLLDQTHLVKTGSARILNLSTSGACMVSRVTLSLGEQIQGRLISMENERVKISGRVVWIRPGGSGVFYGIHFR